MKIIIKNSWIISMFLFINIYSQETKYLNTKYEFKPNETVYLFGDNVKLRKEPNTITKEIEILKIGTAIEIIEKTDQILKYNGFESSWYKVNYQGKTGYIVGGLIALDRKVINTSTYLIALKKDSTNTFALTRVINNSNTYLENQTKIFTDEFSIKAFNNKGLDEIENIFYIDYLAEACGINGGGIYLFNDGTTLKKAIEITSIGDGGVYWFVEELIFPNDKDGKQGKLIYKKESGEVEDDGTNWTRVKKMSRELEWKEGQLLPKIESEND